MGSATAGRELPASCSSRIAANTRNELNGAQLVLDGDLLEFHRLDFGATLKAGIFDNFAQGTILETYSETNNDLSAYARRFSASCHHLAFLGGVGVNAGYHVTDEISICVGYDVVFLSNLALGPEQINGRQQQLVPRADQRLGLDPVRPYGPGNRLLNGDRLALLIAAVKKLAANQPFAVLGPGGFVRTTRQRT